MGSIPFLDHLGTYTAYTLLQVNNRNRFRDESADQSRLSLMVVPEWIFRLRNAPELIHHR